MRTEPSEMTVQTENFGAFGNWGAYSFQLGVRFHYSKAIILKNFYQILGVAPTATQDEIKKAYRFRASKFHPDKHQGDKFFEEEFKELKNAYDILSDPTKRVRYDQQFNKTEKEETNQKTKSEHQNENVYSEPKKAEEAEPETEPAANSNFTYLFVIGALILIIFLIVGLNSGNDTSSPTNYTSNEQSNPEPTNIWFNNVIHWFSVRTPAKFERQELNYEKGLPGYTEQINMIENYNFATDSYVGLFLYMDTKFDSYNNSRGRLPRPALTYHVKKQITSLTIQNVAEHSSQMAQQVT